MLMNVSMVEENNLLPEWQADNLITEIKELEADKERFTVVAENKCKNIMAELENKTSKIDNEIEFKKAQLRAYFMTVERKSTKTQETYSMFSGKLVMKKAMQKIVHDDEKLLEWAKENAHIHVKTTTVSKFDWMGFKYNLGIENGLIINKATGEVIEVDGIGVEEISESFEVK